MHAPDCGPEDRSTVSRRLASLEISDKRTRPTVSGTQSPQPDFDGKPGRIDRTLGIHVPAVSIRQLRTDFPLGAPSEGWREKPQ